MLPTCYEISFVLDDEIWEACAFGGFPFLLHGTVCDDTPFAFVLILAVFAQTFAMLVYVILIFSAPSLSLLALIDSSSFHLDVKDKSQLSPMIQILRHSSVTAFYIPRYLHT